LLAAASIATSLAGRTTLASIPRGEVVVIGAAFVVSICACLYILIPKRNRSLPLELI
jgi:hypothetical protein